MAHQDNRSWNYFKTFVLYFIFVVWFLFCHNCCGLFCTSVVVYYYFNVFFFCSLYKNIMVSIYNIYYCRHQLYYHTTYNIYKLWINRMCCGPLRVGMLWMLYVNYGLFCRYFRTDIHGGGQHGVELEFKSPTLPFIDPYLQETVEFYKHNYCHRTISDFQGQFTRKRTNPSK